MRESLVKSIELEKGVPDRRSWPEGLKVLRYNVVKKAEKGFEKQRLGYVQVQYNTLQSYAKDRFFTQLSMKKRGIKEGEHVAVIGSFYPLNEAGGDISRYYRHGIGSKTLDEVLKRLKHEHGVKAAYCYTLSTEMRSLLRSMGFKKTNKENVFARKL